MHKEKFVFAQLAEFLNGDKFRHIVDKYNGNSYVKSFTCWNQLLVLMFGQLSNRKSLRDLALVITAHSDKCYHLGFGKSVTLSNLSKANAHRDYRIFEEYAYYMIGKARSKRIHDVFELGGNVYAFDSTTIDLCLSVYEWARFRRAKGGIKIHTLYDLETQVPAFLHITEASVHDVNAMDVIPYEPGAFYVFDRGYNDFRRLHCINEIGSFFVVRAKDNLNYKAVKWKRRMPANVVSDSTVRLAGYTSEKKYPDALRRIVFFDEEQDRTFTFLTNALTLDALTVALLYKNRWQIELFFKWMKQHLNIQRFWGTTENAVRIQIYSAITAFCLVAIVHHDLHLECSVYETLQIIGMSLTDTKPLKDLLNKSNFNNVKEQIDNSELLLFSC